MLNNGIVHGRKNEAEGFIHCVLHLLCTAIQPYIYTRKSQLNMRLLCAYWYNKDFLTIIYKSMISRPKTEKKKKF